MALIVHRLGRVRNVGGKGRVPLVSTDGKTAAPIKYPACCYFGIFRHSFLMTDDELYTALGEGFPVDTDLETLIRERPLLAHYTSIPTLESILRNNELWFSNPLFMNDLDELRWGINQALHIFNKTLEIYSDGINIELINDIKRSYYWLHDQFALIHSLDVYVFCLREHERGDTDGALSMWRAYGGNGNGAALVFNTKFATTGKDSSPLLISKIIYATNEQRMSNIEQIIYQWWNNIKSLDLKQDKIFLQLTDCFNK